MLFTRLKNKPHLTTLTNARHKSQIALNSYDLFQVHRDLEVPFEMHSQAADTVFALLFSEELFNEPLVVRQDRWTSFYPLIVSRSRHTRCLTELSDNMPIL